ncbi:MAG TPA: thiamine pyrophosphate-binding protein [Candidatus Acidoferrum sp.]|nr:thiamine pyrophosphate-binding protein [Candidatus Acidoferrum sp.]
MIATRIRSGGEILAAALRKHGVDLIFGVPGESYLAALDGFYRERDALRFIACRHEGAAAHMAEAYGKLTGRPGICTVTRGPGATHASIGVHTAMQDSTPMILFVGQVAREMRGREAWQEIDVRATFSTLAKWAEQIDDARRIPEIVSRAFYTATSGRPGPVVLALPEDMLTDEVDVEDAEPFKVVQPSASAEQIGDVCVMLARADRPLVLVGGSGWDTRACADLQRFAEMHSLPVVTTFRRQDLFDNRHRLYAGHAGLGMDAALAQRIRDADLLLAIGPRLGETSTNGYRLLAIPRPEQRLIHVHPSANELGRVYAADLPINAGTASFVRALAALPPPEFPVWKRWAACAHQEYLQRFRGAASARALDLTAVMHHLSEQLPKNAILTNGAGNYAIWLHRYYQYAPYRTQLAPNSGAMGYGLPAAIAAKLVHPERTVVNVAGDGCFLMTGQELATAVRYDLPVIVLVVNNASYGSIRAHQEMQYPERVIGTDLTNPDFVAFARSFGAYAERVEKTEQFAAAFERARNAGRPAVLELITDPDVLTPERDVETVRRHAAERRH